MRKEQIAPEFLKQLEQDGLSVQAILASLSDEESFGDAMRKIRMQTANRYPKRAIRRALNGRREVNRSENIEGLIGWLKQKRRRRFVLESDDTEKSSRVLAEDLANFAKGTPTDFIVWNCLAFEWQQDPSGDLPPCRISSNMDTSIVLYFKERLSGVTTVLAKVGTPRITVLVPDSEATDERIWKFLQPPDEREQIIAQTVSSLNSQLASLSTPINASIQTQRWSQYLQERGVAKRPEEYTREGEQRLLNDRDATTIYQEALDNGVDYFRRFGITVNPEKIARIRMAYYGMYVGEGAAMKDIRDEGTNVMVLNFEEFRVPRLTLYGANGFLPIVTPIDDREMNRYYRWEAEQSMKNKRGDFIF